ncbi:MAG TPA: D-alanyl-D-alanine carboxypeptidase, partial [Gammaproteobacteria bacterium]|nr:D-alanyl-D-alanine carboxypeptidase [Gammaproteobacteria bacterium]
PLRYEFMASLPIAGLDGTMRKRLNGDVPLGNVRIKTGLLRSVRSMAGYVRSKTGKQYLVVSLQNHAGIQNTTGTLIQDEILKWLYQH